MNPQAGRSRLAITWSPEARAELRGVDRSAAIALLHCLDRYSLTRIGDLKTLQPPLDGLRLRCGNYRVLFDKAGPDTINITGVRNRRDAYR